MFDKPTHGSEGATCGCHNNHKYVVFVNLALCEFLIFAIVEVNASDRIKIWAGT